MHHAPWPVWPSDWCRACPRGRGGHPRRPVRAANTAAVVTAADAFRATLDAPELSETVYPFTRSNAEHWSNLPGATRNGPTLGPESAMGTATG